VRYNFSVTIKNPIPVGGYFYLKVPEAVKVTFANITWACTFCNGLTGTPTWDSVTRLMKFSIFTSYTYANQRLDFWVNGFVNPGTTTPAEFQWSSFAVVPLAAGGTGDFPIDELKGLTVTATLGELTVTDIYPTDNNFIYGRPTNYTIAFYANHDILTDYDIKITFPEEYYIKENRACIVGSWDSDLKEPIKYEASCLTEKDKRIITFGNFLTTMVPKQTNLNLTIDSIVNPGTLDGTGEILVQTVNRVSAGVVDSGSYTLADAYFKATNITEFYVEPKDTGVG